MYGNRFRYLSYLVIFSLGACASPMTVPQGSALTTDELLRAQPLTGETDVPALADVDVLEVDQDMLQFLAAHVDRNQGSMLRLRDLLHAIITSGDFGLEYDETTRTAQDTFRARRGNCLSFTNMFVAMAREVGLDVTYQEVAIPPDWSLTGETFNLSRHINAYIDLGAGITREVDFNIDNFQGSYDRQLIADSRALAHYYSNIGAEYLQEHRVLEALRYFRKSLAIDPGFAPAWSNLGVLYSQEEVYHYAEAAYLQALEIDPHELVAMSNLGQLYAYQEQHELADWYNQRSDRHRMRNPYFRYHLAYNAFMAEDYDAAIRHLKYSVRKEKHEDSFYFLMGLSHLQTGDASMARRWLEKAEQVAVDDALKRNYHSKLERLLDAR